MFSTRKTMQYSLTHCVYRPTNLSNGPLAGERKLMKMLINSTGTYASTGGADEIGNPATGELTDTSPNGTLMDAKRAVAAG
jgi:hypothetical protein